MKKNPKNIIYYSWIVITVNVVIFAGWKNSQKYRKSGYFCCRLIFSKFAGQLDSQKYFS